MNSEDKARRGGGESLAENESLPCDARRCKIEVCCAVVAVNNGAEAIVKGPHCSLSDHKLLLPEKCLSDRPF